MKMVQFTPVLLLNFREIYTMLYTDSKALEIFNSLYWLKDFEFYIGSKALSCTMAQKP